jgi:hypothetical protein
MANRTNFTQSDVDSFHWLKFNGQNGEVLYALSGIILVNMAGASQDWLGESITCKINIPELPAGSGLFIHYHTPFAALNSIFNAGQAVNGGHSVNNVDLVSVHPNGNYGSKEVTLALNLAVRDSDAYLLRVGFNIIMSGVLRPLPPVDPCKAESDELNRLDKLCNHGGYEGLIEALQAQLQNASPSQKPDIIKEIGRLQKSLQNCPIDLANADAALTACRVQHRNQ